MYYLTYALTEHAARMELDQYLVQLYGGTLPKEQHAREFTVTRTVQLPTQYNRPVNMTWISNLNAELQACEALLAPLEQRYYQFQIPKRSGGLRTIDAPVPALKLAQRKLLSALLYVPGQHLPHLLAHNAAYAYVPGRSPKQAMITHQQNESHWFLKLDIKDFFPSTDVDFLLQTLAQVMPLSLLSNHTLLRILNICLKNDRLPQGAPTSPLLSNLVMIPYDHAITAAVANHNKRTHVYTRYADDILISSRESFNYQTITQLVKDALASSPYKIKDDKTRYGSRAGRNWNLGLMLNKDNQLSLGHMKKHHLRAALHSFLSGELWSAEDTYSLVGELGYLKHIEPEAYATMVYKLQQKTGTDYRQRVKQILNQ